jgi:membrane-bound lytic murein transglycosylase A
MIKTLFFVLIISIFSGCSKQPMVLVDTMPNTYLVQSDFSSLTHWDSEDYRQALNSFLNSCKTEKTKRLYTQLCEQAKEAESAKLFFENEFTPYKIENSDESKNGLLTGYYEPMLKGSLIKHDEYIYPIYRKPKDLVVVDLSSIYPELKNYRLRGRLEGDKLVPYYTRAQSKSNILDAEVVCFCDSKIDRFFLEIQGSGRVHLDDNNTMYIGFENQNGHRYSAIGRYLVKIGALSLEDVSLQSIREWLDNNPSRVDEVLNYNESMVFFQERGQGATGALGLELTPLRSIAVDTRYIPLGSMLYLNADVNNSQISKVVFAQDTGGAIKGRVRADLFLGSGEEALEVAGKLKAPLSLWMFLPKKQFKKSYE